jgi:arylsulfatase A-like enzyme
MEHIQTAARTRYFREGETNLEEKHMPPLPLMQDEEIIQEQPDQAALTERYVEQCVRFIRENRQGPFFLYFAHMYVHQPIIVPQPYLEASENGNYGAAVEHVDWTVAVLLDELRRQGIEEDTLVIFTSDNGSRLRDEGGSNGPLRGRKGTTWEGGMRLPCIMHWPGTLPEGVECDEVSTSMDFLPTLVGLAGGTVPDEPTIDGKDIFNLMRGDPQARSPHEAFFYFHWGRLEAVRAGKWKLHVRKRDEEVRLLYDLEADIGETTDRSEAHPEVVQRLEGLIAEMRPRLGDRATGVEGSERRPIGRVADNRSLTMFDPTHPYFAAEYDTEAGG